MTSLIRQKKLLRFISFVLIFLFTFTSISVPYAEARDAIPEQRVINDIPPLSDTVNQPRFNNANVIIAPPSDLPIKPGKERVEIPSRRSANTKIFLEPDGTFTKEIYSQSIFYQNDKKQFLPIESNIVPAAEAAFKARNKSNRFNVSFGDNSLMRFQQKDMYIELVPANPAPSKGVINGNKIKYANIYPNVDIEYTSGNDFVKEDIILHSPDAPYTFTFNVKTRNLNIQKDAETGLLTLYNKKGEAVAYFMAPFMVDANEKLSYAVTLDYQKTNGKETLVVTADEAWLKDPDRKYPVKIDPTIVMMDVHKDTFVAEYFPTTQFSSDPYMYSGYHGYFGKTRSQVQYVLPSLPSSSKVTGGSMELHQYWSDSPVATLDIHRNTTNWTASQTTWNNQPSFSPTIEGSVTSGSSGYWNFNIPNLIMSWYAANVPNYGVTVKNRDEMSSVKAFQTLNLGLDMPRMTINYQVDPIGYEDVWGFTPEGVNGFNGNLLHQVADLELPGRGIPVSFTRTYNSRSTQDGIL
ncbi:MAG: DNRLRE domain-containing protein, partial [Clostridia bacterium]|nr:DNRLRE domain-containing protein [Clostridia bacterium]